jgi:hypothetical protein
MGLSLGASTGEIFGTPTGPGIMFTIQMEKVTVSE